MVDDELSLTFAALADPTRRAILARLANGEATVNEIAAPFSISLQAISKHLKVLEKASLITRGRDAQWRPCRLETAPLESASSWIEENRKIWGDRLDRLDEHLKELKRQATGESHEPTQTQREERRTPPKGKKK
jgi:DNA-binding transcriptional ArsR family regulator